MSNKVFVIFEWVISLALGLTSIFCMKGVIQNYISGATSFRMYYEPITELPTLTICPIHEFRSYTYGKDFIIIYSQYNSKGFTLLEGKNNLLHENMPTHEEVYLKKITTFWSKETCFILATNTSIDYFYLMNITIKYDDIMQEKDIPSLRIQLTSKANSYGLIKSYWPDGEVLTFDFGKFTYQAEVEIVAKKNVFIEDKGQCSNDSFHKTIMLSDDFETCPRKCLPLLLPDLELPLCKDDNETECIVNRIGDITDFSIKKACQTLEFEGKVTSEMKLESNMHRSLSFFYHFAQPANTIVSEEYLVYDFIGMVASIGGTLGLFIGFSFTSLATFVINIFKKLKDNSTIKDDVTGTTLPNADIEKFEESQQAIQKLQFQMDQVLKEMSMRRQ